MVVISRSNIIVNDAEKTNNSHKKKRNQIVVQALNEYKKHMVNEANYKDIKERGLILENK